MAKILGIDEHVAKILSSAIKQSMATKIRIDEKSFSTCILVKSPS
ncbi:MAG: hypothetical protein WA364_19825 [Candidatus Nitrosopolaris sp.]